jgi:hypothetical protein
MNRIGIITCLCCLWCTAEAFTTELPALVLHEGDNTVSISVLNQGATDRSHLAVEVDRSALPAWLAVIPGVETVTAPKGQKSTEKLALTLRVKDAPNEAQIAIPLSLRDSAGEKWTYTVQVSLASRLPSANALYDNSPNPFNPTTTIRYALKESMQTSITIYNSLGQKVRTLIDRPQSMGMHTVMWDGRDDGGRTVSSGVYLYRLKAGNFTQTRKMLLTQ